MPLPSTSSLQLQGGVQVLNPTPLDPYYGPYASVSAANAAVDASVRSVSGTTGLLVGRTVAIEIAGIRQEYWWDGGTADGNLVLKTSASSGSGAIYTDLTGTNAYVGTPSPAITSYEVGKVYIGKTNNTNTGNVTITLSGLSVIPLFKLVNVNMAPDDILANEFFQYTYDGTNFQYLGAVQYPVVDPVLSNATIITQIRLNSNWSASTGLYTGSAIVNGVQGQNYVGTDSATGLQYFYYFSTELIPIRIPLQPSSITTQFIEDTALLYALSF